jgi:predicted nucleic acid-binding protein
MIEPDDLWAPATCLAQGLTMISANPNLGEFAQVPGLAVEVRGGPA